MNTAVLFSGGKDSGLALMYALKESNVKCLITMISENNESYMFHIPNIQWAEKQAEAIGIPILIFKTKGEKEKELIDLENAIKQAIKTYKIQGIYTGALASQYQASRIQKIADKLKIKCFNPLWQKDQFQELNELIDNKFEIMIVGIAAEGFNEKWLGRILDKKALSELHELHNKFKINPAFEGGEAESFMLNAPYFKKKLVIKKAKKTMTGEFTGIYEIESLVTKQALL